MNPEAMHKLTYGLFVVTAREGKRDNGCILNTVMQLTEKPYQLGICVNQHSLTHDMIRRTGAFTVSVLSREAEAALYRRFGYQSGRETDKFAAFTACKRGANGVPYITVGTNAYMAARVRAEEELGTHTLFIGEVTDMEVLSGIPSATYADYLRRLKSAVASGGVEGDKRTVWRCAACGYEYVGERLPADFVCPVCHHPASDFEKVIKEKEM